MILPWQTASLSVAEVAWGAVGVSVVTGLIYRLGDRSSKQADRTTEPLVTADDSRTQRRALEMILSVSARMNTTRNPAELMNQVTSAVVALTGFEKAALYVWSDISQVFVARSFAGDSEGDLRMPGARSFTPQKSRRFSHHRHRYANVYMMLGGEITSWSGCDDLEFDLESDAVSCQWPDGQSLVAPFVSNTGEMVAYLCLASPANQLVPSVNEMRHLEFFTQHAMTAIESAELYQTLARNNAKLSLASEKLNSLTEMKKNFIANVSHELRTPLTSISAYTELLQNNVEKLTPESQGEFLQVIHTESIKLTAIINDILELSQMENGPAAVVHEDTSMAAILNHLHDSWQTRAVERSIDLQLNIADEDLTLPVDSMLIQQLLTHLVNNAFKFTPDGGSVRIRLTESGTAVRLIVEDSGIGIPEDKLGEIFDRFFQVDGSTTREHSGQGLGLALCHDIVSNHEGRIWAENRLEGGARFIVLLPRRPAVLQPSIPSSLVSLPFEAGEFMERLMLWVSESLGVKMATLLVPDESGQFLDIRAAIGLPESVVQSTHIRYGSGISGQVWQDGKTMLINDVTADPRLDQQWSESRYSTPSLLCVPLIHEEKVVGVISVNNKIDGSLLDHDDRVFLESLAVRVSDLLYQYNVWQTGSVHFQKIRETLRATTAVGHLRQETVLQVCHEICLSTARRVTDDEPELENLAFALQFYDVGLSSVPPQLLNKPGALTEREEQLMQEHVSASLEMLEPIFLGTQARQIIACHHENFDGSGYPSGIAGDAIPLGARLLRLTDTLGALLNKRPWRDKHSLASALQEIDSGRGERFCPEVTAVFLEEVESRRDRILELQRDDNDSNELKRPALDRRGMVSLSV